MDNVFNWKVYLKKYPDLKNARIDTEQKAQNHYNRFGKSEGRSDQLDEIILLPNRIIDLTDIIKRINDNTEITFYSSNICIIKSENNLNEKGYILIVRYVNYLINRYIPKVTYSLNKYITLDTDFKTISEFFFEENYGTKKHNGIEDIKLFKSASDNQIYYIGNIFENGKSCITSGIFSQNELKTECLKAQTIIKPDFTDNTRWEKNWCYFNDETDKLCLIYSWYPLKICEITIENILTTLKIIEDVPDFFKTLRGSTNGYRFNDDIWFICHENINGNYKHIILIFDKSMKLKKASNFFKFEGFRVEFCLGLIVEESQLIISYSINDNKSKIGIYNLTDLF